MPCGRKNCPSPLPEIPAWHEEVQVSNAAMPSRTPQPKVRTKVPVFVNFWMRLLPSSTTKTFPLPSTATPTGPMNCPSPLPMLPHVVTKGQGSVGVLHTQAPETPPEACAPTCPLRQQDSSAHVPPHGRAW